jgi:hypothetical protein
MAVTAKRPLVVNLIAMYSCETRELLTLGQRLLGCEPGWTLALFPDCFTRL